jgi:fucose permease
MFAVAGLLCGTFTARFPALVDRFDLSPAGLSAVLFGWALSAALAALLVRDADGAVTLRAAAPTSALGLAAVAAAPDRWGLFVAILLFGAAFGALEIAVNQRGAALERVHGRPLLGGLHAAWGLGAVAGGVLAAGSGHLGIAFGWSVGPVALAALPVTVLLARRLPRSDGTARPTARPRRPTRTVSLLCAAAFAAFVVECSVADWSGMLLRHDLGASHALAALGYPLFQCGLLTGRLVTDRIRAVHGSRRVLAGGGLATAAVFAVVPSVSDPRLALLALFAVGATIGPVLPTLFSVAGTDGAAVARVGAAGYAGLLIGPVAVGALTGSGSLGGGLGTVIVGFGLVIVAVAAALPVSVTARPIAARPAAARPVAARKEPAAARIRP